MNRDAALTPQNHGRKGNPHPQYDTVKTYETALDSSGLPWLKVFELQIASPDLRIPNTAQRIFFGFKVFDNASDTVFSVVEFTGYIGMSGDNLNVQGTKRFAHQHYLNPNNAKLNLHLFWQKHDTPLTWTVKMYLEMPWKYKRAVIVQPWINLPKDRYVTTPTNPLMSKLTQREKTDILFGGVAGKSFVNDDAKNADVNEYTDYQCTYNDLSTHTQVIDFNGMLMTCIRSGNLVSYSLHGQTLHTITQGIAVGYIPVGYRPASTVGMAAFRYDTPSQLSPFSISQSGAVVLIGTDVPNGKTMYGSTSTATMDSMP